jgi:hypothetical protein
VLLFITVSQLRQVWSSSNSREREDSISGFNSIPARLTAQATNISIGDEAAAEMESPAHFKSPQSATVSRGEAGGTSVTGQGGEVRPAAAAFDGGGVESDRVPLRYPETVD